MIGFIKEKGILFISYPLRGFPSLAYRPNILLTPQAGFEPATNRLTVDRSTTELLRIILRISY